jgi:hypothetical protein
MELSPSVAEVAQELTSLEVHLDGLGQMEKGPPAATSTHDSTTLTL